MSDEEMKALQNQENQTTETPEPAPAPEKPKAKTTRKTRKSVNLDEALKHRATGATGYRAYYHQLLKDKNRK